MNPILVTVAEYSAQQWGRFVDDLVHLIREGLDTPAFVEHRRTLHGITPSEVPVALLDAHLRIAQERDH